MMVLFYRLFLTFTDNHLYVLYYRGTPAGYAELNYRETTQVELIYFGMLPEFIGQRLGPYFLHYMIQVASQRTGVISMLVKTCTLDHPKALETYTKAGFVPYKTETKMVPVPDWFEGLTHSSLL
jgi:GNAT superfamily N-acetyltransferase